MKKNLLVSVALLAAVLSSCATDESDPATDYGIRVGAEVYASLTKAPVTTGTPFTAAITAVEVAKAGDAPDWTAEPADGTWWQNSVTLTATVAAGSPVELDTPERYHATRTTCLAAWYPNVPSRKGLVTFADLYADGTTDVMWGDTLRGNRANPVSRAFHFTHALTQLVFKARASGDYLAGGKEVTIQRVEVLKALLPQSLSIADGGVTYAAPSDLAVPSGVAPAEAAKALLLTGAAEPFGAPLMIGAMDEVTVKVTYTVAGNAQPVTVSATITDATLPGTNAPLALVAGNSHEITLVVNKYGLSVSAQVDEWKTGNGGNINI